MVSADRTRSRFAGDGTGARQSGLPDSVGAVGINRLDVIPISPTPRRASCADVATRQRGERDTVHRVVPPAKDRWSGPARGLLLARWLRERTRSLRGSRSGGRHQKDPNMINVAAAGRALEPDLRVLRRHPPFGAPSSSPDRYGVGVGRHGSRSRVEVLAPRPCTAVPSRPGETTEETPIPTRSHAALHPIAPADPPASFRGDPGADHRASHRAPRWSGRRASVGLDCLDSTRATARSLLCPRPAVVSATVVKGHARRLLRLPGR